MANILPPASAVASLARPRRWVTGLALGLCVLTLGYTGLMVSDWLRGVPWGRIYGPLHMLVFGCDTIILAAALLHMRHQPLPYRWACVALMVGNLLTILSSLADAPAYHSGSEASMQIERLLLYIAIYVCGNGGLALLVPLSLPRLSLLRLGVDTLLAMTFTDISLQIALPLLLPDWHWTPTLTIAKFRLIAGVGLALWYALAYWRLATFRDPLVRLAALGVLGMVASDLLLFWATYATTHGANPTTLNIVMPPWMAQQTLWAYGLYQAGRIPFRWQRAVSLRAVAHGRFAALRSFRHSLVIIVLAGLLVAQMLIGVSPSLGGLLWFVCALISREALWSYEFSHALRLLQQAQADLKRSREALEAFVRKVLHDLRGPIQFLHTVRDELPTGPTQQMLHAQTRRMERLSYSLQHYLAERQLPLVMAAVDVVPLAIEVVELAQLEAEARAISVSLSAFVPSAWARADEHALRRILDNLLSNALRATSAGGTVVVSVQTAVEESLGVMLSVQDSGCGIPPEQLATIFQPEVSSFRGGTGLGLVIVSDLCEAMGARCLVASEPGVGSTFLIQLPWSHEGDLTKQHQGAQR